MSIEVKVLSDTHNEHHLIRPKDLECDILIHCGDWGTKGNYTESENFLKWFARQPAKYKLFVPGNHDGRYKKGFDLKEMAGDLGLVDLTNNLFEEMDTRIWGCDYVPFFKKSNQEWITDGVDQVCRIPFDLDILVTHAPPGLILDTNKEGIACGSMAITREVKVKAPKHHVFGHIHERGGISTEVFGTTFWNCAVKDRRYNLVRGATSIVI